MWKKHPYLDIEVHPDGRTRLLKTMMETFGRESTHGYKRITLGYDKYKRKDYRVHRLVAETFIENPLNKPFINHKNGNKQDNRVENLEWCTPKENSRHLVDVLKKNYNPMSGKFGKNHNRAKAVLVYKDNNLIGEYGSAREAARMLNIGCQNISSVIAGKRNHAFGYVFKLSNNEQL